MKIIKSIAKFFSDRKGKIKDGLAELLVLLLIFFVAYNCLAVFAKSDKPTYILLLLLLVAAIIIIGNKTLNEKLKKIEGLGVIITILVFLSSLTIIASEHFNSSENIKRAIETENYLNKDIAYNIVNQKDQTKITFSIFTNLTYRENWGFIIQNYSSDCIVAYLDLVKLTDVANMFIDSIHYADNGVINLSEKLQFDNREKMMDIRKGDTKMIASKILEDIAVIDDKCSQHQTFDYFFLNYFVKTKK